MTDTVSAAVDARRHVLTTAEFDVLWEWLGLGATPVVLQLTSPGRTHTERRMIQAEAWRGLRERELAGPAGPDPETARLMHLLARPAEQLELRGWWGEEVRALAAGRHGVGALAVREADGVVVTACGSLPSALLSAFPPADRGPGRACTVPSALLASAATAELRPALIAGGVPETEATLLTSMLAGTSRRAQVVALAADRWGVLRRAGGVLGVLDGPRGRYLLTRTTGEDGVEWATVAPTDARQLRHRIAELLAAAVAAAGS
ncbi:MAG TPA: ESX secretion-associated protein EspG [Pseudonocardia sp.]|uniref:ESX secretion-associated protein EspG n=1 Tax=Pseudonocardia sp. TaxID=60912 RepID=UPI002B4B6D1A|nr:ESX secretion-associated protein EspG [Pseudonocardia sp.]HLU60698.1 ESX secretion-associated protein EspG [Pseudonocardia sp.]